ncbi:hypothetical protein [Amycolatopsis alkalitolerans]|uniref:hypothetical protein n=1 Tax=Amycolatopsis alkalitolerans TaxID=2547244 RepID=UPI001359049B|nr:hypothetical protein [Amycolatopsis alkalitolerans]
MARHSFEENDNDEKWGGPELAEKHEGQPQSHRRERDKAKRLEKDGNQTERSR